MEDRGFHEECGIVGVFGHGNVVDLIYYALYALQHRGQEGAGIVVHNGTKTRVHRGLGLVSDIFTESQRRALNGRMGIGHNRYATTGKATKLRNVQPILVDYKGGKLAIAHNGNLTNAKELRRRMERAGSIFQTTTDSEIVLHLVARSKAPTLPERLLEAVDAVEGAMSCLVMNEKQIIGYRDPRGFRPLALGSYDGMHILASESCALDILGAHFIREIEPGEMIVLDADGIHSRMVRTGRQHSFCMFEQIYFSRPDSHVFGESVNAVRRELGRLLARRHPVDADVVIAVPDSSNSAALGYADESEIPFELGLIRNHYVGRTFIRPGQRSRVDAVRVKFNPVVEILEGRRIVVVDDSIVRGTTSRQLVRLLRKTGAKEVHFRVSSPAIQNPCYYGIDTPRKVELIRSRMRVEEICSYIGADSLGYLTTEDLRAAVKAPQSYCLACFTGEYPTSIPQEADPLVFDVD
ncbi:MAG: amidophosphoribosyltransferase [Candidatus Eisenbacteria bacterium]|nr:amidophosphoribosyltransferase [Candidatus Latescibacterota bacterium]MBD3301261.1 amidophosphoribosyltransferase [Candidatus Eisenbacteria bacterium]